MRKTPLLGIFIRAGIVFICLVTIAVCLSCPIMKTYIGPDIFIPVMLLFILLWLTTVLFVIFPLWFFMLIDWGRRMKSDPDTANHYTVSMIVGWPFGYYFKVYEKKGQASK